MEIVTVDFETYYDREFSLSKMTTEEYVRHPNFQVIMLGIRWPDGKTEIVSGSHEAIQYRLDAVDWSQYGLLAHNMMFDGAILSWRFGVKPKAWLDTLSMARAMFGVKGNSLGALAKRYNLEDKGTEVANMMGRRRESLTPEEFERYAQYCLHDVDLCFQLFNLMANGWYDLGTVDKRDNYPIEELRIIDRLIRMYTEPTLMLNQTKLEQHLAEVIARKEALLAKVTVDKEELMSNQKFAELLYNLGVVPPMKVSPTTGKQTFAFAKTDPGLKALLDHPDEEVQALVAARLGVKSTLEETRTQRFIDIAKRGGAFPIPLKYGAARTHRLGGMDSINLQNLPSRGAQANKIKSCIEAPPGYVIIDCDSSNIEARMLAWLAGQDDLVEDFANNVDVYCKMASQIFGRPITKEDKMERFIGKTVVLGCFGPDTQVLTDSGVKSIVQVSLTDKLWDGESWVTHQGLLNQGPRIVETPTDLMLSATADHEILTEHGWRAWSEVHSNPSLRQSALNRATLPSSIGSNNCGPTGVVRGGTLGYGAPVGGKGLSTVVTLSIKKLLDVATVLGSNLRKPENITGDTQTLSQTMLQENDSSIGYRLASTGAKYHRVSNIITMGEEVFACTRRGLKTAGHFWRTSLLSLGGITNYLNLTGLITTVGTNPVIYAGQQGGRALTTGAPFKACRRRSSVSKRRMQTYDIALAGPNNRFTVLTAEGPLIVHNCGYQTGKHKLQATLKASDFALELPIDNCASIISRYRDTYHMIPRLWREADVAIETMHADKEMWLGREGVVRVVGRKGIKLPSGLYISYPSLHYARTDEKNEWRYKDETGLVNIYGGKLVENVVQALARIVVMQQLMKIAKRYRVVLTVHDAVACIAKKEEAEEARAFVEECMRWVPPWAAGCPINCESGMGENYGAC